MYLPARHRPDTTPPTTHRCVVRGWRTTVRCAIVRCAIVRRAIVRSATVRSATALFTLLATTSATSAQSAPATANELSTRLTNQPSRLRAGLEATSSYQTNPRLLRADDEAGRTDAIGVFAEAAFRLGRTRFNLIGDARVHRSAQLPDLNRDGFDVRLTAARRVRPRTTAALTIGTRRALAIELVSGITAGVGGSGPIAGGTPPVGGAQSGPGGGPLLLPTARVRFDDARITTSSRLSATTSLDVAALANRTAIDSPGLFGGAGWSTESALHRRLSSRMIGDLRVETASARTDAVGQPTSRLLTVGVGPTIRVARYVIHASAGASRVALAGSPSSLTATAAAAVDGVFSRGYGSLFISRRASPSFGQERVLISTGIGFSAGRALTRSTGVALSVQQMHSTAPLGQGVRFASTTADFTLRQRLIGRAQLTARAFFRDRDEVVRLHDTGVALSLAVPLRQ